MLHCEGVGVTIGERRMGATTAQRQTYLHSNGHGHRHGQQQHSGGLQPFLGQGGQCCIVKGRG